MPAAFRPDPLGLLRCWAFGKEEVIERGEKYVSGMVRWGLREIRKAMQQHFQIRLETEEKEEEREAWSGSKFRNQKPPGSKTDEVVSGCHQPASQPTYNRVVYSSVIQRRHFLERN